MIINVKVKTNSSPRKFQRNFQGPENHRFSRKEEIQSFGDNRHLIYLKEKPENNEANHRLINLLSKHFGTPPSHIKIKFGATSNEKMIEIL